MDPRQCGISLMGSGNLDDNGGVRTGEGRSEIADALVADAFVSRAAIEDVLSKPDGVLVLKDAIAECREKGVDSLAVDNVLGMSMDVAVRKGDAAALKAVIDLGATTHRVSGQVSANAGLLSRSPCSCKKHP